jgi:hypothetical protein
VHSSPSAASLQQHQMAPTNDLYMKSMLFTQQPWKAVLVDAAGKHIAAHRDILQPPRQPASQFSVAYCI